MAASAWSRPLNVGMMPPSPFGILQKKRSSPSPLIILLTVDKLLLLPQVSGVDSEVLPGSCLWCGDAGH